MYRDVCTLGRGREEESESALFSAPPVAAVEKPRLPSDRESGRGEPARAS